MKNQSNRKADTLEDFLKALRSLKEAVTLPVQNQRDLAGIIQNFEFTYELCWKCLKRVLEDEGKETLSPKSAFRGAFEMGFIKDEDVWVQMIQDRNLTVHTYNEGLAKEIATRIAKTYLGAFEKLAAGLKPKKK